jgi:hypothetical protein
MSDDASSGAWWHKPLVGAAGIALGSISSFVSSHWNGVSQDDLAKALAKTTVTLEAKIDSSSASCSDKIKAYADAAVAAHEKRSELAAPKKRKVHVDP